MPLDDVLIIKARYDINRYFIFRNDGQEIDFTIKDEILDSKFNLSPIEREFIYINIMKFKTKNPELLKIKTDE